MIELLLIHLLFLSIHFLFHSNQDYKRWEINRQNKKIPSIEIEEIKDFIKEPIESSSSSIHVFGGNKDIIEFCDPNRFKEISDLIDNISTDIVELSIIKEIIKDIHVQVNSFIKILLDIHINYTTLFPYNLVIRFNILNKKKYFCNNEWAN